MRTIACMRRLLSALVGIMFVLATGIPMSDHPCMTQDGASEAMPLMASMPAAPHQHDHSRHQSHRCVCLDSCSCATVVTVSRDRLVALPVVPIAVVASSCAMESTTLRPAQPDAVVLPPPLGPPALLV